MESPRKFNDCYFYYYSTCTKGDNCVFRHEPSALGCETMCTAWQQGKCLDKRCKLRHMELRKNRKQIPCYWENQPGGCRKIHCPFMHKNPDARTDGIAPSQPAPPQPVRQHIHYTPYTQQQVPTSVSVPEPVPAEQPPMGGVAPPVPAPAPVPLLWQQQRQAVVLDSAILGVLPGSGELLGGRRVLPPHAHEQPANPYAPMPVDPLVVNFEEESDNESAPSSTPTKTVSPDDATKVARNKSQELLLLEKIQAEAAAFYSYDGLPPPDPKVKLVRTNLATKYERVSLDEIAGKQAQERRASLDFKVLSLDEIRARKKTDTVIHSKPITLNLSRKRKLSTHETITTSGNKILKVVRSNSVVYKKLDRNAPAASKTKVDQKPSDNANDRKRTLSEQSDIYEIQEDELVDNCFEFKRIKLTGQTAKPKLIRHRLSSSNISTDEPKYDDLDFNKTDDSDSEVQIVSVELNEINSVDLDKVDSDTEIIDLEATRLGEPIDVVDLSEDQDETDITVSDLDLDLSKNAVMPDVVVSCHQQLNKIDSSEKSILNDIDSLLDDDL